ncbi:MAG: hypothetical protein AAF402_03195 [Pseudomonadota bacterium]
MKCHITALIIALSFSFGQPAYSQLIIERTGTPVGGFPTTIPDGDPDGVVIGINMPAFNDIQFINLRLGLQHTWLGDLEVILTSPNGEEHIIFASTGVSEGGGAGDSSDVDGVYTFTDNLSVWPVDWWSLAEVLEGGETMPTNNYRSSLPGGAANAGAITSITDSFRSKYAPGVWSLRVLDNDDVVEGTWDSGILEVVDGRSAMTLFNSDTGGKGSVFSITAKSEPIAVTNLGLNIDGICTSRVFFKKGGYDGFLANEGAWTKVFEGISVGTGDLEAVVDIDDVTIDANATGSFYVHCEGVSTTVAYTITPNNGAQSSYDFSDFVLDTEDGIGATTPFSNNITFSPRTWNGAVYYYIPDTEVCAAIQDSSGTVFPVCL